MATNTSTAPKKKNRRKNQIMIPELLTMIKQPNRVSNMQYNYTLLQEKIFTAVMLGLQEGIQAHLSGIPFRQLDLFSSQDSYIHIEIPLQSITKNKNHYNEVRETVKALAGIVVRVPGVDPLSGKKGEYYQGFIKGFIPEDFRYSRTITISIEKPIAELLMKIDKKAGGVPINYTTYYWEVVEAAKCKYTPRIYKIISSWKNRGGFVIGYEELRERLMLEDKYKSYKDFKRWVLKPAQEELFEKADCWFNCSEPDFEIKKGKQVVQLKFKVITRKLVDQWKDKIFGLERILREHGRLSQKEIDLLKEDVLVPENDYELLANRILEIISYINENAGKITKRQAYIVTSLKKEFSSK